MLAKTAAYAEWRRRPPGVVLDFLDVDLDRARSICEQALVETGAGWLPVEQSWQVLEAMRLPVLPGAAARTAEEAAAAARRIGFPVAVKLASRRLVHKTEVGGVVLNLADEQAVRPRLQRHPKTIGRDRSARRDGRRLRPGHGAAGNGSDGRRDLGPAVRAAGGVRSGRGQRGNPRRRLLPPHPFDRPRRRRDGPLDPRLPLAAGLPRQARVDVPALENVLLRVARLVEAVPAIAELDLNPIVALPTGQGCRIADVRIRVEAAAGGVRNSGAMLIREQRGAVDRRVGDLLLRD